MSPKVVPLAGKTIQDPDELLQKLGLSPGDDALLSLWHAVGLVEKLVPPSRHFRTALWGASHVPQTHPSYKDAYRLAFELAKAGSDIITGSGPGMMEAANAGAMEGMKFSKAISIGISIPVSTEQKPNDFLSREYNHKNFFTRLHHFAHYGRAFVVLSEGGLGTLLELAMIWQLLQRGHLSTEIPLIVVGDMWEGLMSWMKSTMVARGWMTAEEMKLIIPVQTVDDALPIVIDAMGRFKKKLAAG